jgi:glycosyltransferase involved in cell wall biosynthesis
VASIVDPERVVLIHNTSDNYDDCMSYMEGVAELPGFNIVVVGMLNENKGQRWFVDALDRIVDRIPGAVLHFAGRGGLAKGLVETAKKKGLRDRVVLHGYLDRKRLYVLYRQCQIVALPTVWPEPFGRVPLEAGMARRPVVSFKVGGLPETIRHGVTGFLVEAGDCDGFIDALGRLSDDPALRRTFGNRAHDHVRTAFRVEESRERLASLWQELLGAE